MISNAAIGRIDVLGLVYTAAYVPDTNEMIESVSIAEHGWLDDRPVGRRRITRAGHPLRDPGSRS